jgi:MFS family permease
MNCKIIEEFFTLRLFICNFSAQSHHFNIFFMKSTASVQLSLMMFLEYFIWGSWYVTMSTYMGKNLHSTGIQIGAAYSALAIATMISPFIVGLIADRFFAAQRIMGLLHLLGAALLFLATTVTFNGPFYWIILVYSLLYMPTIALSNSIAFNQMKDPGKQFPWIRVFGTLGWTVDWKTSMGKNGSDWKYFLSRFRCLCSSGIIQFLLTQYTTESGFQPNICIQSPRNGGLCII